VNIVVSDEPRSCSDEVSLLISGLEEAVVDGDGRWYPNGVGGTTMSDGPSIN
jgi:hypothetical protein